MCGLAGVIGPDPVRLNNALGAMVEAQRHRGPDDAGQVRFQLNGLTLGLGHRRLAIQDLSQAGHQPMVNYATGEVLIFNGEIYNAPALRRELIGLGWAFRGHSDSEVLLCGFAQWGEGCLKRLEGMYALALFQPASRTLILARDPVGIKPLFWARRGAWLMFASEVRALLASGLLTGEIDQAGLTSMLAYGAPQAPGTLHREIRVFPSGCSQQLVLDDGCEIRMEPPRRFWQPVRCDQPPAFADAITQTRGLLEQAVASHLLSDVPVGTFLSSGLDSTVITALAARQGARITAYTVGFEDDPDLSEHHLAAETARQLAVPHRALMLTRADALGHVLPWLASQDQPSIDGLNTYVISRAVRQEGTVVALSGQGGDEVFGGYPSFRDVPKLIRILRLLHLLPSAWRGDVLALLGGRNSPAVRDKLRDTGRSDAKLLSVYLQRRRLLSNGQLQALGLAKTAPPYGLPEGALDAVMLREDDPVWTLSHLETLLYLGNTLLPVGDATSMAHSLEIRVPMLDRRILDTVLTWPGKVRMPPGSPGKALLRAAFAKELRPALTQQTKRGFVLPVNRWMLGPLRDFCNTALGQLSSIGILNRGGIQTISRSFLDAPESPAWTRAWALVVLGFYLENHAKGLLNDQ